MIEKRLIDVQETAKILHCGINKAYGLCRQADFPSVRIGRKILVDLDALYNTWLPNRLKTEVKGVRK